MSGHAAPAGWMGSAPTTAPRVAVRGVARAFRGGAGVHGIDLEVAPGEIHAIVGLNGAGKTTLMRLMLGMLRPSSGTVSIGGVDLRDASAPEWRHVGHLVEHPFAYAELDGRGNLVASARLHGLGRAEARAAADRVIAEFGLARYADVRASRLSLGNRQRVGLAAALVHDPDLIVLDEPTNGLDPSGVIMLRESLVRRAAAGAGVLVSSHHLDEVARIADRITVINDGRAIGCLDPDRSDLERAFFSAVLADDTARAARETDAASAVVGSAA